MILATNRHAILILCLLSFPLGANSAAQKETADLQQMMSADEFKAAGLEKLSPEELQNLNKFLQGFRTETLAKAAKAASIEKLDLIVSSVNGEFTGLKGRTVIRLANGTAWRQANPEDNYKGAGRPGEYVNLPAVVMKKGLFGYKMRIAGTPEFYVTKIQ